MLAVLRQLMRRRSTPMDRLPASLPMGERVYAVGDIHGRNDLLKAILEAVARDAADYDGKVTLVCIGDYIDRGPDSKGVIDTLLHGLPRGWNTVFIRGNHEQAMIDFLKNPKKRLEWLAWGGIQALESYGVRPYGAKGLRDGEALAAELEVALSENPGHRDFILKTQMSHVSGDYAFVHAGVRAGVPLEKQMPTDLLFIRDDFFGRPHRLPLRVVFGHTILPKALLTDDRIGLDTGAFQTGVLTAVRLQGIGEKLFQAKDRQATEAQDALNTEIQEG